MNTVRDADEETFIALTKIVFGRIDMTTVIKNAVQEVTPTFAISNIASNYTYSSVPVTYKVEAANETSVVSPDTLTKENTVTTEPSTAVDNFDESMKRYNSLFESLIERRAKYDALLNKHSDLLYAILSDCLALCVDNQRNDPKSALRESLEVYREAKNAKRKIQENTPFETVIVRFVFEESNPTESESISRSQASVYSAVLRKAIEANVAPTEFAAWVKKSGGVDKIRREREETEKKQSIDLEAKTKEHFSKATMITEIKDAALSSVAEKNDGVDVVLIARQYASGQIAIIEVIRDEKIIKTVKKTFIKSLD